MIAGRVPEAKRSYCETAKGGIVAASRRRDLHFKAAVRTGVAVSLTLPSPQAEGKPSSFARVIALRSQPANTTARGRGVDEASALLRRNGRRGFALLVFQGVDEAFKDEPAISAEHINLFVDGDVRVG